MKKYLWIAVAVLLTISSLYAHAQNTPVPAAKSDAPAVAAAPPAPAAAPHSPAPSDTTVTVTSPEGSTVVHGGRMIMMPRRSCEPKETGSIDINFQYSEDDVSNLSKEMDDKVADIKSQAVKAGATATDLTEMNYTVNSGRNFGYNGGNDTNGKYNISGRMHFNITPAAKAAVLLQSLSADKNYHVSLNFQMNSNFCPPGMMQ